MPPLEDWDKPIDKSDVLWLIAFAVGMTVVFGAVLWSMGPR